MNRSQIILRTALAIVVLAILSFGMGSFQVSSNEAVIVTRFGSPRLTLVEPGLYGKMPWPIDQIHRFDTRLSFHETRISEALTKDKRNVIVPLYVAWRITDPLRFLQAVGSPDAAPSKLDSLATSARNTLLGRYEFSQLVSTDAGQLKLEELERELAATLAPQVLANYGITLDEVGIKRIALPEANTAFVLDRMRAERGQYAARYRADGHRVAEEIRAQADADKARLLADARRYAEETRGRADAEAARLYAEAHSLNPRFYQLYRELESLRRMAGTNTSLVLDTGSAPFSQLNPEAASAP